MGILEYILLGIIFGFLMEHLGKYLDMKFNFWERIALWVFWPILLLMVIYSFLREFFR
jgi:predicted permease